MADIIKPFLCDSIEKSLLRAEWEKWLRSFQIYVDAEEIISFVRKRNKLLHFGGQQLQAVAYSLPGAVVPYDEEKKNDVYTVLVEQLNEYFTPKRNSAFERHLFRSVIPLDVRVLTNLFCDCVSKYQNALLEQLKPK